MKASFCSSVFLILQVCIIVNSEQGVPNTGGQQQPPLAGQPVGQPDDQVNRMNQGGHPNIIQTQNREHIKEHLDGVIEKSESEMTQDELTKHYFTMHDYDHNNKLDGVELIHAITHFREHSDDDEDTTISEKELENMIDPILQNEDKNSDGYIDYPEYAKSQKS